MTDRNAHPSNSAAQLEAEGVMLEGLARELDVTLERHAKLELGDESTIVDGFCSRPGFVLVEVYAHVGALKGSQPQKVMADALKLVALRNELKAEARLIILLADEEARDDLMRGWRREALKSLQVEVRVARLSEAEKRKLTEARHRQRR